MQEAQTVNKVFAIGRRKESVARVQLFSGKGDVAINARPFAAYFPLEAQRLYALQPFSIVSSEGKYDVNARIAGGGIFGQAGALRLGIARALVSMDANLRPALLKAGLLTRDPRMRERKKYGQKGARKRFQWTKR